ncbi:MAG: GYD domain-containing protein [Actinobacteria bacterium]|nr:GYD domain-containing protein [Actinomycetota bacterium]MCI0544604.1 GYD domain-containing protein [Actinomycetota bacterium]MCI0678151.1 GYD domain-containing protein [Actinomycetota bacterium]
MATYIILGNYTSQGIKNVRESPARLDAAREQLSAIGVQLKDFYLTMGQYDIVGVVEAPDNMTAARALLALGAQGNVSTTTLAALTEDEFRSVMGSMS